MMIINSTTQSCLFRCFPVVRIVNDVFSDFSEIFIIPDDVFVIISVPYLSNCIYFILDFIYFLPFSPVSCTDNADNTASICETNRDNSISDFAKTVLPLFNSQSKFST